MKQNGLLSALDLLGVASSRRRGLKQDVKPLRSHKIDVASSRRRGLKQNGLLSALDLLGVASSRRRGLKLAIFSAIKVLVQSPLHGGVD